MVAHNVMPAKAGTHATVQVHYDTGVDPRLRGDDVGARGLAVIGPIASSGRFGRIALNGAAVVTLAYILTPLVFVTWLAFFRQEIPSFPPEGYSLRWFRAIAGNDRFVSGFLLSLQLAVIATSIGLCLGLPAALCISRSRFRGREALSSLLLLPLVVPGIVLGIALYVFHVEVELATGLPILGSLGGLIAGHVLIVIPWTVRLVTASLAGLDRSIEEAAQSLGANRFTTFRRVTLPAIRPGVVAAALFGFVSSFGNLEMSLFIVGPGRTTLPIAILQYLEWKIDPTIAAVSVLQIGLIATAMLITDRFVKISRVV
jgi:putative spermidine/putrescine transport system permease protein